MTQTHHLSLGWVTIAATVPLVAALVVALPFWIRRVEDLGSILGAGVILAAVVALIAREYAEMSQVTARCIAANVGCRFEPLAFTRYGIYAGVGMVEIFAVFLVGLWIEERLRRRRTAPQWR